MKKAFCLLAALLLSVMVLKAQSSRVAGIVSCLQNSQAEELAEYFNSSIDLTLVDDDNVYSKTQASMVMKDFFAKYPPEKVAIKHSGSSRDGSSYAILSYKTKSSEMLRVVFYLKSYEGNLLINELRFEIQK